MDLDKNRCLKLPILRYALRSTNHYRLTTHLRNDAVSSNVEYLLNRTNRNTSDLLLLRAKICYYICFGQTFYRWRHLLSMLVIESIHRMTCTFLKDCYTLARSNSTTTLTYTVRQNISPKMATFAIRNLLPTYAKFTPSFKVESKRQGRCPKYYLEKLNERSTFPA